MTHVRRRRLDVEKDADVEERTVTQPLASAFETATHTPGRVCRS